VQFKDEARWKSYVADLPGSDTDGKNNYGEAIVRVATQWADLLEEQIEKGNLSGPAPELEALAHPLMNLSAGKDVSDFQISCAARMLSDCWIHGERLRVWWNTYNQQEGLNKTPGAMAEPPLLGLEGRA